MKRPLRSSRLDLVTGAETRGRGGKEAEVPRSKFIQRSRLVNQPNEVRFDGPL